MYDIPEQYNCYSNIFSKPYVKNHPQKFQNGLCAQCNAYETKKINALANFVAENEKKYDTEIEKYRVQLESQYSLCTNCQLNINNVLIKQSKWLMQYKMSIFKDKPVLQTNLVSTGGIYLKQIILSVLSSCSARKNVHSLGL